MQELFDIIRIERKECYFMHKIMTRDHKLMAYVLNKKFNYQMKKIADLMNVSQSTISTAIKEVEWMNKINDLTKELEATKKMIASNYPELLDKQPIIVNLSEKIR